MKPSSTKDLIAALKILSAEIISGDGVARLAIAEAAERLEELSVEPESYTPMGEKKLSDLIAQGGEHIRDAKVLRFPGGSECTIDKFGKVNWITPRYPDPKQKEFWSHNEEDSWVDNLDEVDTDQMFFDDISSTAYKGVGVLIDGSKLIDENAIDSIFDSIIYSAGENRQNFGYYLPDYWLVDFSEKESSKVELKQLIVEWLKDKGQFSHYTVDECKAIQVELVDGHLEEVE